MSVVKREFIENLYRHHYLADAVEKVVDGTGIECTLQETIDGIKLNVDKPVDGLELEVDPATGKATLYSFDPDKPHELEVFAESSVFEISKENAKQRREDKEAKKDAKAAAKVKAETFFAEKCKEDDYLSKAMCRATFTKTDARGNKSRVIKPDVVYNLLWQSEFEGMIDPDAKDNRRTQFAKQVLSMWKTVLSMEHSDDNINDIMESYSIGCGTITEDAVGTKIDTPPAINRNERLAAILVAMKSRRGLA